MARAVGFIGIYIEKCAFRHGPDGHGNGMSAPSKAQRHRDFGNVQIQDDTEGAPPSDDERMDAVGGTCRLVRSVIGMLSLNRPTAKCDEIVQAGDLIFGFFVRDSFGRP